MKYYSPTGRRIVVDLWREFWILETGTGQQVSQLHERYMMMMMMMILQLLHYYNLSPYFETVNQCNEKCVNYCAVFSFFMARQPLVDQGLLIVKASRSHWVRHTTLGRTPLDEWSARRRDLYLTTHNRQTSMQPARFEHAIPARERQQTHTLVRAGTGIGLCCDRHVFSSCFTSLYTPITFLIDTNCLSTLCYLYDNN